MDAAKLIEMLQTVPGDTEVVIRAFQQLGAEEDGYTIRYFDINNSLNPEDGDVNQAWLMMSPDGEERRLVIDVT